jgi:hypothetical protein
MIVKKKGRPEGRPSQGRNAVRRSRWLLAIHLSVMKRTKPSDSQRLTIVVVMSVNVFFIPAHLTRPADQNAVDKSPLYGLVC